MKIYFKNDQFIAVTKPLEKKKINKENLFELKHIIKLSTGYYMPEKDFEEMIKNFSSGLHDAADIGVFGSLIYTYSLKEFESLSGNA